MVLVRMKSSRRLAGQAAQVVDSKSLHSSQKQNQPNAIYILTAQFVLTIELIQDSVVHALSLQKMIFLCNNLLFKANFLSLFACSFFATYNTFHNIFALQYICRRRAARLGETPEPA